VGGDVECDFWISGWGFWVCDVRCAMWKVGSGMTRPQSGMVSVQWVRTESARSQRSVDMARSTKTSACRDVSESHGVVTE
jgi:hypothetical protein